MSRCRQTNLKVGYTYGVGSLTHAARTIVRVACLGQRIWYVYGPPPATSIGNIGRGRTPGKEYEVSRVRFLRWLRQLQRDDETLQTQIKGTRCPPKPSQPIEAPESPTA